MTIFSEKIGKLKIFINYISYEQKIIKNSVKKEKAVTNTEWLLTENEIETKKISTNYM